MNETLHSRHHSTVLPRLNTLAATSWGQQKEILLMTYKAVARSIINYAVPVWSPNLHDTNYTKIKYTQNEALRIATGCHKMSSIDHLLTEAEMMIVRDTQRYYMHSTWLDACNQAMYVTPSQQGLPLRDEGDTIHKTSKHGRANDGQNDRKATLQALHNDAVNKTIKSHERNVVLDGRPPPKSSSEKDLTRKERSTLAQLRSRYCRFLGPYKRRIK